MNVLISDEDTPTRQLIARVLEHKFGVEVEEASNGLDALDKLQQKPFGALIMEARMPVMGGLETLQVLRESAQFSRLPVMILTAERDERLIKLLIKLGVQDVILKPTSAERFGERFERLLQSQDAVAQGASAGASVQAGAHLSQGATALIADGDVHYIEYFRKVAGARFTLTEAGSGAKALEACLKHPPEAVFLGTNLGVMGYDRIVSRLRAIKSRSIRIFAVPPKSEAEAVRATGVFDDVIVRTYVPALFGKELARLLQPLTAFVSFRDKVSDIQTRVVSAVEQVLGVMLTTDVEPVPLASFGSEARAVATVTLTTGAYILSVLVRLEMSSGRKVAAAFLDTDGDGLADEDIVSVAGELANVLMGRLYAGFQERKIEGAIGLPVLDTEPAEKVVTPVDENHGIDVHFRATDRAVSFQIVLTVESSEQAATGLSVDAESGVAILRTDG